MKQDVNILIFVTMVFIFFMTIVISKHIKEMKKMEFEKPSIELATVVKKRSIW